MTPFGLLFVGYALLSFYTGLDVMFAGLAQALQNFRRAKVEALAEARALRRELDDLRGQ